MLLITGFKGRTLVAQAAFSGDKAIFEAVTAALLARLRPEQVRYRLFPADIMVEGMSCFLRLDDRHINISGGPLKIQYIFLHRGHYAHWKYIGKAICYDETGKEIMVVIHLLDLIAIHGCTKTFRRHYLMHLLCTTFETDHEYCRRYGIKLAGKRT